MQIPFPTHVEAVVLAGGPLDGFTWEGEPPPSKGFLPIHGTPMAALTLRAVVASPKVGRVILVSPLSEVSWPGVDHTVPAADQLVDSFVNGVAAARAPEDPVLICCGDMPLLSEAAVTDFVRRCEQRPEASMWFGYLRRENSERVFPHQRHTWAKLADGSFCGAGLMMIRPHVVAPVRETIDSLTRARKNVVSMVSRLGWGTVFSYLIGRLTVRKAEEAGWRVFGVACAGVESPFAETGFNVDDNAALQEARLRVPATTKEVS